MKSYTDVSVDLETYGTEPGCVILEVAFTAFDRRNPGRSMAPIHRFLNIQEQVEMGFKINHDTVTWWASQPDKWARQNSAERYPVDECVHDLIKFIHDYTNPQEVLVWAKGSHFDLPILRTIMPDPWHFRNIHDLRTLAFAFPFSNRLDRDTEKFPTHHGLEDSLFQAMEVQALCSMIVTGE